MSAPYKTVWSALVWKEWCEHRWKLVAFFAILLGTPLLSLLAARVDQAGYVFGTVILFTPIASAFLAMSVAAGERSRGTLPLLQALPCDLRRVAVTKLLAALLTFVLPMLAAAAVMFGFLALGNSLEWVYTLDLSRQFRDDMMTGNALLDSAVLASLFGVSIICWVAALGVNRESEVRAGAISLSVVVGLWAVLVSVVNGLEQGWDETLSNWIGEPAVIALAQSLFAIMPGGIAAVPGMNSTAHWIVAAPAFFLVHSGLAAWYVYRFGQTENTNRWSAKPTEKGSQIAEWLDKPRSSPLTALAWKQLRESGPIAAAGFAGAVGVATLIVASNWNQNIRAPEDLRYNWRLQMLADASSYMLVGFGFLSGLIAGVGSSAGELQPKLVAFWRSRPIRIDQWFWTKYGVTVLILLGTFVLPALLLYSGVLLTTNTRPFVVDEEILTFLFLKRLGVLLAPMLLGFSTALFAGCVLRHTVYAAMLSLVMSLGLIFSFLSHVQNDYDEAGAYVLMLVVTVGMTIAAWLAARYDWSFSR